MILFSLPMINSGRSWLHRDCTRQLVGPIWGPTNHGRRGDQKILMSSSCIWNFYSIPSSLPIDLWPSSWMVLKWNLLLISIPWSPYPNRCKTMGSATWYGREEEGWVVQGGVGWKVRIDLVGTQAGPTDCLSWHSHRSKHTHTEIILCVHAPSGAHLMVHLSRPSKSPFYLDRSHQVLIDPNGLESCSNGLNLWAFDDSVRISAWGWVFFT